MKHLPLSEIYMYCQFQSRLQIGHKLLGGWWGAGDGERGHNILSPGEGGHGEIRLSKREGHINLSPAFIIMIVYFTQEWMTLSIVYRGISTYVTEEVALVQK